MISPLISNVFLHYVLDLWFENEVKPRLRGHAFLIRYADDFRDWFSRSNAMPIESWKSFRNDLASMV